MTITYEQAKELKKERIDEILYLMEKYNISISDLINEIPIQDIEEFYRNK